MTLAWRFLLPLIGAGILSAQSPNVLARIAEKGVAEVSVRGAAIPLNQSEGGLWTGALRFTFTTTGADGSERKQEGATMNISIDAQRRAQLLGEWVSVPYRAPVALRDGFQLRVQVAGGTGNQPLGEAVIPWREDDAPLFRAETAEAAVAFQFEPARGRGLIRQLTTEDIVLKEDGVPVPAVLRAVGQERAEGPPVQITLLFDCSGSVVGAGVLDARLFRKGLLDEFPNASIAVSAFSDTVAQLTPHTRDEAKLEQASRAVQLMPPGATPLFRAVAAAVEHFDYSRPAMRILVVFSDGESTTPGDLGIFGRAAQRAREAGVHVYPVQLAPSASAAADASQVATAAPRIGPVSRGSTARQQAQMSNSWTMQTSRADFTKLAPETGGRALSKVNNADVLAAVLTNVAAELRNSYVVSYQPRQRDTAKGPVRRNVRVELRDKSLGKLSGGFRTVVR